MKSFLKIFVAIAALGVASGAMANANPAKNSGGKPGYTAFCEVFKKDCNALKGGNGQIDYLERNIGKGSAECECTVRANDKAFLRQFNQMCENRGLKHNEPVMPESLAYKGGGGGISRCNVH